MKCIYKIRNTLTNEIYIGSALDLQKRKWHHLYELRHNKHHSPILQNSYNKNGKEIFIFEVVEDVKLDENLIPREQYYIDTLNPKYNCSKTAGSPLGVKHTLQSKTNMSKAHIGLTKEERGHKEDCSCPICNRKVGKDSPRYIPREERNCACGCGNSFTCMITSKQRFISGHNKSQLGRIKTKEEIEKQRKSLNEYYEQKRINRSRSTVRG